jgi:uncharacterized protein (DUF3084 family)
MKVSNYTILFTLIVLGILGLLFVFFSSNNKNLRESLKLVKNSQEQLNQASEQIGKSREETDSVRTEMKTFGEYTEDIRQRVHMLDLEQRTNDKNFLRKKDSINILFDSLYKRHGINNMPQVKEFNN